ncbi:SHOCT domain-containing protein [Pontiella sulfatireligans]|uniref:SHOCT domain-containing protein n=1 Tax=Pontiella sulfatireligans TaxID=2750658 RepID=A0A6C2UQQ5_9BACT|nr:SHOCT domain-containing protein [Pontiella sulfatireligans]VGO21336.1 hypothetical protein SCARR_03408 [Pontiella sulfatireligans]
MKTAINMGLAALAAAVLSGCAAAAFNRVSLTTNRNITVGQELLDLQAAHEKGIINDSEYKMAKQDLLKMVSSLAELKDD